MKRTTPSPAEALASLLPSEMDPDERQQEPSKAPRDFVAGLKEFDNPAAREHRYVISRCPMYLRRQIEVFAGSLEPPKSLEATIAYCLDEGLMLIDGTPGLNALREARKTVLDAGDDAIAWFEEWSFELKGRYTGRKTLYARVHPSVTARCNQLAYYTLGLPASTLACLAIEAV